MENSGLQTRRNDRRRHKIDWDKGWQTSPTPGVPGQELPYIKIKVKSKGGQKKILSKAATLERKGGSSLVL
jgi:hypothetical protein